MINREIFFDKVRPMFGGGLSQGQVDGMNAVLTAWESRAEPDADLRHLAYPLATDKWETSSTMLPIEEYGKGSGMSYGKPDPQTKQTYYGRGYVQLTWRDNYAKADKELGLSGDESLEWHAENALDPIIAAEVMFQGMEEGWFRSDTSGKQTLSRYFNDTVNDAFNAREIINGDKNYTKEWANHEKVGNLIKTDHNNFLKALEAAYIEDLEPVPEPVPPDAEAVVFVTIQAPAGIRIEVNVEEII